MILEWDDRKAEDNLRKHGITFEEAASALSDPLAFTATDDSEGQDRNVTIAMSPLSRILVVVSLDLTITTIRIISARKATPKERTQYEEGI